MLTTLSGCAERWPSSPRAVGTTWASRATSISCAARRPRLFGFACRSGARIAGREDLVAAAGDFGEQIGIAFQVVDDMLDLSGDSAEVGKSSEPISPKERPRYLWRWRSKAIATECSLRCCPMPAPASARPRVRSAPSAGAVRPASDARCIRPRAKVTQLCPRLSSLPSARRARLLARPLARC